MTSSLLSPSLADVVNNEKQTSPITFQNSNQGPESIVRTYHGRGCPCCQGPVMGQQLTVDWAPATFGTVQQLANQLTSGYNGWSYSQTDFRLYWNLGSTGIYPKNGVLKFNVAGTNNQYTDQLGNLAADTDGITDANYLDQIREAFKLLGLVTGITFQEVTGDNADIDFTDNQFGRAYARTIGNALGGGSNFYKNKAHINIDPLSGFYGQPSDGFGGFFYATILHEIYHVLGLGHLGDYNGTVNFDVQAVYKNDYKNLSIMSYVTPASNPYITIPNYTNTDLNNISSTGMVVDAQAIDDLYSSLNFGSSKAFLGDTVYGYNTTITAGQSKVWNQFTTLSATTGYTIVDGGGNDTIDLSGFNTNQSLDLRAFDSNSAITYFSDVNTSQNNLSIAPGSVIENAVGGLGMTLLQEIMPTTP